MIWGYHYFRKHPYIHMNHYTVSPWFKKQITIATYPSGDHQLEEALTMNISTGFNTTVASSNWHLIWRWLVLMVGMELGKPIISRCCNNSKIVNLVGTSKTCKWQEFQKKIMWTENTSKEDVAANVAVSDPIWGLAFLLNNRVAACKCICFRFSELEEEKPAYKVNQSENMDSFHNYPSFPS